MTIQGLVGVFSSSLSWENIIITSILGFIVYYYLSYLSQQHRTRNQGRTLLDTSNPTAAVTAAAVTDADADDDNDKGKNGSDHRRCDQKGEKEKRRQRMIEEERERMIEKRCELFDHNKKKDSNKHHDDDDDEGSPSHDNENSDADVNNVDPISRSGIVTEATGDDPAISSSVAKSTSTTDSFEQIEEEGGKDDNDVDEKEESLSSFELVSSENITSDNDDDDDDDHDHDHDNKKEENHNDDKVVDASSSSEVLTLSIETAEEDEEAIVAATNQNDDPPQSDPNNEIMTSSTSIVAATKDDDDDNDDTDLFGLPLHSPTTTADTSPSTKNANTNTHNLTSFHIWHDAIANIYRLYNIGPKEQDNEQNTITIPPQPKSERGYLPIKLRVMNQSSMTIQVYWLDFQGKEEWKGIIPPYGGVWNQTTWIGHPWIFRELKNHSDDNDEDEQQYQRYNRYSDGSTGRVLLHFIPYRVIPTTENVVTVADHGDALQSFTFYEPPTTEGYHVHNSNNKNDSPSCTIVDNVFTYPSSNIRTPYEAIQFSCDQLRRENISPRILLKYLCNIQRHPYESKYRIIRVSNKVFWDNVWINGGRGILHALGFVEVGPYLKVGNDDGDDDGRIISFEWMDLLSNTISILEELRDEIDGDGQSSSTGQRKRIIRQPPGADGSGESGRAGWG